MSRIAGPAHRRIVVAALAVAATLGSAPGAARAGTWSPAARLTTSSAPYAADAVGAFAQPDGSFLLSGYSDYYSLVHGSGFSTADAGGTFPAPSGPVLADVVWLPDGTSLAEWNNSTVQQRAADGTFVGSPQLLSDNVSALGADAAGNATAAGVLSNNGYSLHVYGRAFGASSFTEAPAPVATSAAGTPLTLVGLVVDPGGAADVTWVVGSTLYEATRAAGAPTFGAPAVVASDVLVGVTSTAPSLASNPSGQALIVYFDGSGYSATTRVPGGAFAAPVDFTGALTPDFANSAAAVAGDGSAAAVVRNSTPSPGCGNIYSLLTYRLPAGGGTWAAAGTAGGTLGDSVSYPVLAGGAGSRIDAAWTTDTSSSSQTCGKDDSYELDAGTLGGTMNPILSVVPPSYPTPGPTYGSAYGGGFYAKMALSPCGDGALIIGIADASNSDTHDGLFTSSTTACPAGGGTPPDTGPAPAPVPTPPGPAAPPVSPGAPAPAAGPSAAQLKASLLALLTPGGKPSKIAALLHSGSYAAAFTPLATGTLAISWFEVPAGAHLSKAKPKPVLVAGGRASVAKGVPGKVSVKLTGAGKKLLRHATHLKLTAKGTFTPGAGAGVTGLATFTLKR